MVHCGMCIIYNCPGLVQSGQPLVLVTAFFITYVFGLEDLNILKSQLSFPYTEL